MKKFTRIASLLLAVLMVLAGFAGCGKTETEDKESEYIYTPEYFDFGDEEISNITAMTAVGGKIYAMVYMNTGKTLEGSDTDENGTVNTYSFPEQKNFIFEIDTASGEKKKLEGFDDPSSGENNASADPAVDKYSSIVNMFETADGKLAVVRQQNISEYNLPNGFDETKDNKWNYISKSTVSITADILDENGAVASTVNIMTKDFNPNESYFGLRAVVSDKDGNWYVQHTDGISVLSPDGKALFEIKSENGGGESIVRTSEGKIASLDWNSGIKVKTVDAAKKAFTDGVALSQQFFVNQLFTGDGKYSFFGTDQNGIVGVNIKDGSTERVLNWLDSDISPDYIQNAAAMENGDFVIYSRDWSSDKSEIIRLVKTKNENSGKKQTITMAVNYLDSETRNLVSEFNKKNTKYRIKVKDYSQYGTADAYDAGITKLNTEIIAGKAPDIIAVDSTMPVTQYATKGILEDLTPYIERDIGKDALVEDFFKTLRDDNGKLYEVYPSFSLQTLVGLKKYVGDGENWDFDAMWAAYEKLPEGASLFSKYFTRSSAMYMFLYSNMDRFVNWETGECSFDNEEFIKLLETVKAFPSDEEAETDDRDEEQRESSEDRMLAGKQLLNSAVIMDLVDFRASTFYAFGKEEISFVGYPGKRSAFLSYGTGYAISSKSEHKDAAWEFISQVLTADYQKGQNKYGYYNGIPTNKEVFEDMMKKESTPNFGEDGVTTSVMGGETGGGSGEKREPFYTGAVNAEGVHEIPMISYYGSNNVEIPVYAMTDYEKEVILGLIKGTETFMRYDTSLSGIINEEVQPFFKGEKSAADAAKMIQSRATIYVNEQK